MTNNYCKVGLGRFGDEFFPFDDQNPKSIQDAILAAKTHMAVDALSANGVIAFYRPIARMTQDMRCVGHAPEETRSPSGAVVSHTCLNCGQIVFIQ